MTSRIYCKASEQFSNGWFESMMKCTLSLTCCLLLWQTTAVAAGNNECTPVISFEEQLYSRAPLAAATGGESSRLRRALYAVNPYDAEGSDSQYYCKLIDSLVRVRTILDNEEESRKSKTTANNSSASGLDKQLSSLIDRVENERATALLDKVELTKRQIVFLANQLKDDLSASLVYPSSSRKAISPASSPAANALKSAFRTKVDSLCSQVLKDCIALDRHYQVRLNSIGSSGEGLKQQMTSTVGSNKVSDMGTSMYVRNYVNFGGVEQASDMKLPAVAPPAALLATPGRLNSNKAKVERGRPLR
ncbi:MAG: hypothetical protein WCT03_05655 [Candidatus Obscuribacterales bacterium]